MVFEEHDRLQKNGSGSEKMSKINRDKILSELFALSEKSNSPTGGRKQESASKSDDKNVLPALTITDQKENATDTTNDTRQPNSSNDPEYDTFGTPVFYSKSEVGRVPAIGAPPDQALSRWRDENGVMHPGSPPSSYWRNHYRDQNGQYHRVGT